MIKVLPFHVAVWLILTCGASYSDYGDRLLPAPFPLPSDSQPAVSQQQHVVSGNLLSSSLEGILILQLEDIRLQEEVEFPISSLAKQGSEDRGLAHSHSWYEELGATSLYFPICDILTYLQQPPTLLL